MASTSIDKEARLKAEFKEQLKHMQKDPKKVLLEEIELRQDRIRALYQKIDSVEAVNAALRTTQSALIQDKNRMVRTIETLEVDNRAKATANAELRKSITHLSKAVSDLVFLICAK